MKSTKRQRFVCLFVFFFSFFTSFNRLFSIDWLIFHCVELNGRHIGQIIDSDRGWLQISNIIYDRSYINFLCAVVAPFHFYGRRAAFRIDSSYFFLCNLLRSNEMRLLNWCERQLAQHKNWFRNHLNFFRRWFQFIGIIIIIRYYSN